MKKIALLMLILVTLAVALCGCYSIGNNSHGWDMKYTFHEAIIYMPNGAELVSGDVSSWRDFEDGDEIQITIDGVTYLTHYSNVVMIRYENEIAR